MKARNWKKVAEDAGWKLELLSRAARRGEREAIAAWIGVLRAAVDKFDRACHRSPNTFAPFARKMYDWPTMGSRVSVFQERSSVLLENLHVAEDCELNFYKGKFATSDEAEIARMLWSLTALMRDGELESLGTFVTRGVPVEVIKKNSRMAKAKAAQLPRFTKGTHAQWWDAAKHIFIAYYGEDFHLQPAFVKYVANGKRQEKKVGQIKDDIRKKVRQAFRSIAV